MVVDVIHRTLMQYRESDGVEEKNTPENPALHKLILPFVLYILNAHGKISASHAYTSLSDRHGCIDQALDLPFDHHHNKPSREPMMRNERN